jgi:hypothetical protein
MIRTIGRSGNELVIVILSDGHIKLAVAVEVAERDRHWNVIGVRIGEIAGA